MANNFAFLETSKKWGTTFANAQAAGYLVSDVHPPVVGHQDIANSILIALDVAA